jgi:hypothetical protein
MAAIEQKAHPLEAMIVGELQMEKTAGVVKTAADQIDEILIKMSVKSKCSCGGPLVKTGEIIKCSDCGVLHKQAAELDGSDIMNKVNPVGKTNSGTDARSLGEGLRRVEADKHTRGTERMFRDRVMQNRKLKQTVIDPAIFTPERGTYPLRPSGGFPKVGTDMLKAAASLERMRTGSSGATSDQPLSEFQKRASYYLKNKKRERVLLDPRERLSTPSWENENGFKRKDHFEDFLSLAEQKKGKALSGSEVDGLIAVYNKAVGSKIPLTKDWNHGHLPFSAFDRPRWG